MDLIYGAPYLFPSESASVKWIGWTKWSAPRWTLLSQAPDQINSKRNLPNHFQCSYLSGFGILQRASNSTDEDIIWRSLTELSLQNYIMRPSNAKPCRWPLNSNIAPRWIQALKPRQSNIAEWLNNTHPNFNIFWWKLWDDFRNFHLLMTLWDNNVDNANFSVKANLMRKKESSK